MMNRELLMLALMPDAATADLLEELRQEFARTYRCNGALKPPVHITIIPPFYAEGGTGIIDGLQPPVVRESAPFPVRFRNFSTFPKNRVVFVDVERTDALVDLQHRIERAMQAAFGGDIKLQPFYHPHFTIGRKDIPRAVFPEAAKEYGARRFEAEFTCDRVVLLRHDGARWQRHREYFLNG